MQAIESEGEAPKSNRDLMYGGKELREDPGNKEQKEILIEDTTVDKWTIQKESNRSELDGC